jgi:uncharacterized protein
MKFLALVCFTIFVGSAIRSGPVNAASFDCAKAVSLVETSVCNNPQLSALDDDLDATYRAALATSPDKVALKAAQVAWLQNVRNKCATERCLGAAYQARIVSLSQGEPSSPKPTAPSAPPAQASREASQNPLSRCRAANTAAQETAQQAERYAALLALLAQAKTRDCQAAQGINRGIAEPARELQRVADQRQLPALHANACTLWLRASSELERACL